MGTVFCALFNGYTIGLCSRLFEKYFDFKDALPQNPYVEDPFDLRCISFSANGDLLGGNVYARDVMEIIRDYAP